MEPDEALSAIRNAVEVLERAERDRYRFTALPTDDGVPAGLDVIAVPFFYATHKARAEITRRVFRHFRRVAGEVGARVIGVGSEGDVSRALWCDLFDEVDYREYPQTWNPKTASGAGSEGLRAKFDETVRAARVYNPGRVFIGGSDDLIPVEWWREAWKSEADLIGVTGGARIVRMGPRPEQSVISEWDGHYSWAPEIEFCGGGVVMSRDLLDAWNWAPFRDPHCEIGLERRAREEGWRVEGIPGRFWAVKAIGAVLNEANRATRAGAVASAGPEVRAEWIETWEGLA